MKLITLVLLTGLILGFNSAKACTPYGTPLATHTIVGNNLNITVTSTTSWSCSYKFELELICDAANFTGNAQFQMPQTPTINKPNTANLNYPVFTIDISNLCPGTTYKYRVREQVQSYTNNYWSNWSAVNTFVVPGPPYSIAVNANQTLICPPDCADLTATSQNACGPVTYNWNPNIGTGANQTVCPTTPTTYTVTGSVNVPFCPIPITQSASVTIGIEPPAVAGTATINPPQICSGENVTLTLTGYTGNIQWQSSNNPAGPFTNIPGATTDVYTTGPLTQDTYFQAHVFTCTDEYSNIVNVQVFEIPTADFTTADVCLGQITNFNDQSTDNISVDTWAWDFGDGNTSTQQNPTHTYAAPGDYTVSLEVENPNGCTDIVSYQVTVFPIPVASFDFTEVCEDQLTTLNSTSTVGAPSNIQGYEWDINENGVVDYTSQNTTHNFNGYGNYSVSLTVTSDAGCTNSASESIDVFPLPNVDFLVNPLCFGGPTNFTDQTTIPLGGNAVAWQWEFGDGNGDNIQNPTHTYANPDTYTIELTVETNNGCTDNAIQTVDIFPLPVADFNVDNECFYDQLNFQNNSSANATLFNWNFGDGNTSNLENPNHQFNNAGIYVVTLIVNTDDACADTVVQNVTAYAQPQADFNVDPTCLNVGNVFNDNSQIVPVDGDLVTGYSWDFGDGNTSTLPSPNHTYNDEGVYNVSLTVTSNYGCESTFTSTATVWPLPEVNFDPTDVCLEENTQFNDLSQISNAFTNNTLVQWDWNFGDGGTSNVQNPNYTYGTAGVFNATLIVTSNNGCTSQETLPVTVHATPIASFNGVDLNGCSPICPELTSTTSVNSPSSIVNYNWTLSNGISQNSASSMFTECLQNNSGSTVSLGVTLTVTTEQGCSATYSEPNYINIYHNPIADFTYTPNEVTVLDPTVSFNNSSSYADSYNWSFGQAGSSTETNPTIVYPEIGEQTYDVMLVASTNMGCTDTAYALVEVKDQIVFYVPNTFTPDKDNYNETFQPIFVSGFDPMDFHLMIFNRWGEVVFESYNHSIGWDGTYGASSDRIVKDGTYVWKIEFKEVMTDKRHIHTGHINVIK